VTINYGSEIPQDLGCIKDVSMMLSVGSRSSTGKALTCGKIK
jgi:hypothetical protein